MGEIKGPWVILHGWEKGADKEETTYAMQTPVGCLVRVRSVVQLSLRPHVAETMTFVPNVVIGKNDDGGHKLTLDPELEATIQRLKAEGM